VIMKAAVGLLALLFATSAFAQSAPPKAGKRPAAHAKPQAPMGCKLVGTVRGTKLWAGDCTDAAQLRGAAPIPETTPDAGAIPPGAKE
jgi:hypothetical protein